MYKELKSSMLKDLEINLAIKIIFLYLFSFKFLFTYNKSFHLNATKLFATEKKGKKTSFNQQ